MNPKRAAKARPEHTIAGGRIEVKAASDAGAAADGTFSGYGATYEPHSTSSYMLPPDWQDVFKPGAFKRTLGEHKARGSRPSMLYMHDFDSVMGVWESIAEDKDGLAMAGRLCLDVQEVADTYALMKMGAIQSLSVGFVPVLVELDEKAKTRTILDADLFETSIVSVPGNPGALISDVKSFDPTNIRDIEACLREGGMSHSEAKGAIASLKALGLQRDADDDGLLQNELHQELLNALRGK